MLALWIRSIGFVSVLGLGYWGLSEGRAVSLDKDVEGYAIAEDGDTLAFPEYGEMVRLYGIDAPELDQTCRKYGRGTFECGLESQVALEGLVAGKIVKCRKQHNDRYGNGVAVCRVDGVDLGGALIEAGLVWAKTEESQRYLVSMLSAQTARRGFWGGQFKEPWLHRRVDFRYRPDQ